MESLRSDTGKPPDNGGKSLSWYQRNKEEICEKSRHAWANNENGVRDKKNTYNRERYAATKHLREPLTEEQKERKKLRQKAWYEANKERALSRRKEQYQASKDIATSTRLMSKFGISLDEYNDMFRQQKGRCAVCRNPPMNYDRHGNLKRLAVDHDHKTGKVRQLLCSACNTSIGLVKENVKTLNNMIEYIKKHEENFMDKMVTIKMTIEEVQTLANLLDIAVKAAGLQGAKPALAILEKLEAAVAAANAPNTEDDEKGHA